MIYLLVGIALGLLVAGLTVRVARSSGPIRMWQFGKIVSTRVGIKGSEVWTDEPDVVEFVDYKYWIRLRPNPGVNLPVLGYWSKSKGRKR